MCGTPRQRYKIVKTLGRFVSTAALIVNSAVVAAEGHLAAGAPAGRSMAEPVSLVLIGSGFLLLVWVARRRMQLSKPISEKSLGAAPGATEVSAGHNFRGETARA